LLVLADGMTIRRSALRQADDEAEREHRRGLIALLKHAGETGGLITVPRDWREAWT
jgi:hypothetical protein